MEVRITEICLKVYAFLCEINLLFVYLSVVTAKFCVNLKNAALIINMGGANFSEGAKMFELGEG